MTEEAKSIEVALRTVKADSCPSLSERSSLTYEVGVDESEGIHLRITANSGGGYFSQNWVPYASIEPILSKAETFTGAALKVLFQGTSVNTAGFVMAALKHLGIVGAHAEKRQTYVYHLAGVVKLIDLCALPEGQEVAASKGGQQAKGKKAGTLVPVGKG